MAKFPEDVQLEQLLKLRKQLREQIDQLDERNNQLDPSTGVRKILKYRGSNKCEAGVIKKAEKRRSSSIADSCAYDKAAKVWLLDRKGDERFDQLSYGDLKKLDKKDHANWATDNPTTHNKYLRQCPITGIENRPRRLSTLSKINEVVSNEVPEARVMHTTKIDDISVYLLYLIFLRNVLLF